MNKDALQKETITTPVFVETIIEAGLVFKSYIISLYVSDNEKTATTHTYTIGFNQLLKNMDPKPEYETRYFTFIGSMTDSQIPDKKLRNNFEVANTDDIGKLVTLLNTQKDLFEDRNLLRQMNILEPIKYKKANHTKFE